MLTSERSLVFGRRFAIALLLLLSVVACRNDVAAPVVPIDLTVSAGLVDGDRLPVPIEERPGTFSHLTLYRLTMTPDGLWSAVIARYPDGAPDSDLVEIQDNGWYEYDGLHLLMHSNFSHTSWSGTLKNDTISAVIKIPFADSYHSIVLP